MRSHRPIYKMIFALIFLSGLCATTFLTGCEGYACGEGIIYDNQTKEPIDSVFLTYRSLFSKGYMLIPVAGFIGAVILLFFEDGHAPSLLAGAMLGLLFRASAKQITSYRPIKV